MCLLLSMQLYEQRLFDALGRVVVQKQREFTPAQRDTLAWSFARLRHKVGWTRLLFWVASALLRRVSR